LGGEDYKIFDTANKLVNEIKAIVKANANNTVSASGDADLYHFNNFIESIRGNEKPNASIQIAHESVLLCHLANISQLVGVSLNCDPKDGHITGNKEAEKLWGRTYEKRLGNETLILWGKNYLLKKLNNFMPLRSIN